jgi:hypothetical protein
MPLRMVNDGADAVGEGIRDDRAPAAWLGCDFFKISIQIAPRVGDTGRLNDSSCDRALEGGIRP